jgi:hypothetical protein
VVLTAKPSVVAVPNGKPHTTVPNNATKTPVKSDDTAKTK